MSDFTEALSLEIDYIIPSLGLLPADDSTEKNEMVFLCESSELITTKPNDLSTRILFGEMTEPYYCSATTTVVCDDYWRAKCDYRYCTEFITDMESDYATVQLWSYQSSTRRYCSATCLRKDIRGDVYDPTNNIVERKTAPVIQKFITHCGFSPVWSDEIFVKLMTADNSSAQQLC